MASDKNHYLTSYRKFFEEFAAAINPADQLPVKVDSYKFTEEEIAGGVVDWTLQCLNQKQCPSSLVAPLVKIVISEIKETCKKQPTTCGYNDYWKAYEPLKLMQACMSKLNEVCLRYLDNSSLDDLPPPSTIPALPVSTSAFRNTRRTMEDRHVVIDDLNGVFSIENAPPASYYAVFDGHSGRSAASYCAAHLHQYLAESTHYPTDIPSAFKDAFLRTDAAFIEKVNEHKLKGGTTAVCALVQPTLGKVTVAWVGDSLAYIFSNGCKIMEIVNPHRAERDDERRRVEEMGGFVRFVGIHRVAGLLSVTRAIGDAMYKPYVSAEPDIKTITLEGTEDFLVLACDGLWDFCSTQNVYTELYNEITNDPSRYPFFGQRLVRLAKLSFSTDNISVIIVCLRDPQQIAASATNITPPPISLPNNINDPALMSSVSNNQYYNDETWGATINPEYNIEIDDDLLLNNKQNGGSTNMETTKDVEFIAKPPPTNGKRPASCGFDDNDEDDDFGPETSVDVIDNAIQESAHVMSMISDLAPTLLSGLKQQQHEVPEMDTNKYDAEVAKAQREDDEEDEEEEEEMREIREETPTPPANTVLDNNRTTPTTDNVVESGEESDDEWNYIRVDQTKSEKKDQPSSLQKSEPVTEETKQSEEEHLENDSEDDMASQLNPDAAEFVPVSPVHAPVSPPLKDFIDDKVLAESPFKPSPICNKIPTPDEFLTEVCKRPSEVEEAEDDLDDIKVLNDENESHNFNTSAQELEDLLNGKSIDEIEEFHPKSTQVELNKTDNDNELQNVPTSNLLDQSEAFSTKAEFGDETTASFADTDFQKSTTGLSTMNASFADSITTSQTVGFDTDFTSDMHSSFKTQDPMSMSFYEGRDDDNGEFNRNPFDLNAVQSLPDDEDSEPNGELDAEVMNAVDEIQNVIHDAEKAISDTEEKEQESPVIEHKLDELVSALQRQHDEGIDSISPVPNNDAVLDEEKTHERAPSDFEVESELVTDRKDDESPEKETMQEFDLNKYDEEVKEAIDESPFFNVANTEKTEVVNNFYADKEEHKTEPEESPFFSTSSTEKTEVVSSPVNNFYAAMEEHKTEPEESPFFSTSSTEKTEVVTTPLNNFYAVKEENKAEPEESPFFSLSSFTKTSLIDAVSPPQDYFNTSSSDVKVDNLIDNVMEEHKNPFIDEGIAEDIMTQNDIETIIEEQPKEEIICFETEEIVPQEPEKEMIPTEDTEHIQTLDMSSPIAEGSSPVPNFENDISSPIEDITKEVVEDNSIKSSVVDTESVAPSVTSFLARSPIPDITSPLHTTVAESNDSHTLPELDIQENVQEHISDRLLELEKVTEAIEIPAEVPTPDTEVINVSKPVEETAIATAAVITAVVTAAAVTTAIKSPTVEKKSAQIKASPAKKSTAATSGPIKKTTTTSKLGAAKPASTLASKTQTPAPRTVPKPSSTKPIAAPRTAISARPKTAPSVTKTASAAATTERKAPIEKKPLMNGDVKQTAAKTTSSLAAKRPAMTSSLTSKPAPRPATAPVKTTLASSARGTTEAPKARPTSLATKTNGTSATTRTTLSAKTTSALKSPIKPPTSVPPKPKTSVSSTATRTVKSTTSTTTTLKASPRLTTDKQVKETANKQLLSARTVTKTTSSSAPLRTTPVKKTDLKSPVTKTTVLKSTVGAKKTPTTTTRTSVTKTKSTSQHNGTVTLVQEITNVSITTDEPRLLKDESPIVEPSTAPQLIDNAVMSGATE